MINPEKLLGGLLRSGTRRRRGITSLITSNIGLGLVGVAMEAVEHLMNTSKTTQSQSPPPPPSGVSEIQSPPSQGRTTVPPPPPGNQLSMSKETNLADTDSTTVSNPDAILLIRAMIAAANADGAIDQNERERILGKLKSINLNDEEMSFVTHELLSPTQMNTIIEQVNSHDMAKQVYAVSLLSIKVDTDAERNYIQSLKEGLGLDTPTVDKIHQAIGLNKKPTLNRN